MTSMLSADVLKWVDSDKLNLHARPVNVFSIHVRVDEKKWKFFSNMGRLSKLYQNNKYSQVYCGRHEDTYLYTYLYKLYTDKDGVLKRAAFERSMTQTVRC